jgi:hypothetical protein
VVAGCDPALPLLQTPLALLDPPVAFAWWPCASSEALRLTAAGLAHVAGAHLQDYASDDAAGAASDLQVTGAEILRFCSWRVGLVLRPGYDATGCGEHPATPRGPLRRVMWVDPGVSP